MSLKSRLRRINILKKAYGYYMYQKYYRIFKKGPKYAADYWYHESVGGHIDWDNPKDLNQKIAWMQFNTDTSLWTKCADKYRVREYVTEKGFGDNLVKLYGMWENPEDIDFSQLPARFVLKANNGCGTVLCVNDKSSLNIPWIKKELKTWLKRPYGYRGAQLHYLLIKPCIIAEELLEGDAEQKKLSPKSLIDYKIWCINGEPQCIMVVFGRENKTYYRQVYDLSWNKMPEVINMTSNGHFSYKEEVDIPKPACLTELLNMARVLSSPFPEVRADFYIVNNKPYFGELTFTAGMGSFTEEFYNQMGSKIDLSKLKKK